jgi:phage shock protein PspC (stress-responsive transcriptional regulator)
MCGVSLAADLPSPLSRPRRGRMLGGVCAGLADRWGVPRARVRGAVALAALLFGLGVLVYAACWLILPAEGEEGAPAGQRGVVVLAQACGALLGVATLALAGAVGAAFGLGWVVFAAAAAVLLGTAVSWPRVGAAWMLTIVGALALPAAGMTLGGLRLDRSTATVVLSPRTFAELPSGPLRSGLGLLQLDLRRTAWPAHGTIRLRIDAGVRRTLIALPHDRCVHVDVHRRTLPFAVRAASVALGAGAISTPDAFVFGQPAGTPRPGGARPGPTLHIDFGSAGGKLFVRDYPDGVDPAWNPDWPGYAVILEPRPGTTGLPKAEAKRMVGAWKRRHAAQKRSLTAVDRLMPGPCAAPAKPPKQHPAKQSKKHSARHAAKHPGKRR